MEVYGQKCVGQLYFFMTNTKIPIATTAKETASATYEETLPEALA